MNGCPLHGDKWCTCGASPVFSPSGKSKEIKHFLIEGGKARKKKWCRVCDEKFYPTQPDSLFCVECADQLNLIDPQVRSLIVKLAERIENLDEGE